MSAAHRLWQGWEYHAMLQFVVREGFLDWGVYGYIPEEQAVFFDENGNPVAIYDTEGKPITHRRLIDIYKVEYSDAHGYRVFGLFSDMMELYPMTIITPDKYESLRVAGDHDIGEFAVKDVVDDGKKEHEDKKPAEHKAVKRAFSHLPRHPYNVMMDILHQFETSSTPLGEGIYVADKLDALGQLIYLEGKGFVGSIKNKPNPSPQDLANAAAIGSDNSTDVWAKGFYDNLQERHIAPNLQKIAVDFISEGLKSIKRPFFTWWPV